MNKKVYIVKKDNKYGVFNASHKEIIPLIYKIIYKQGNYLIAMTDSKCQAWDYDGNLLLDSDFMELTFQENFIRATTKDEHNVFKILDLSLKPYFSKQFSYFQEYSDKDGEKRYLTKRYNENYKIIGSNEKVYYEFKSDDDFNIASTGKGWRYTIEKSNIMVDNNGNEMRLLTIEDFKNLDKFKDSDELKLNLENYSASLDFEGWKKIKHLNNFYFLKDGKYWAIIDAEKKKYITDYVYDAVVFKYAMKNKIFVKLKQSLGILTINDDGSTIFSNIIDKEGELIKGNNIDVYYFNDNNNFAVIKWQNSESIEKYLLIDINSTKIIASDFSDCDTWNNNFIIVDNYGKIGVIDSNGKIVIPFNKVANAPAYLISSYTDIGKDYIIFNHLANNESKLYNKDFNLLAVSNKKNITSVMNEKFFLIRKNNHDMLITRNGLEFSEADKIVADSSSSYYIFKIDGKWGMATYVHTIIEPQYDKLIKANKSDYFLTANKIDKSYKYGIIDKEGKIILPLLYDNITLSAHIAIKDNIAYKFDDDWKLICECDTPWKILMDEQEKAINSNLL